MTLPTNSPPVNIDLKLDRFHPFLETKEEKGKIFIKDPIRKKWMVLTPEEMVRQLLIMHLLEMAKSLKRLISVEKQIIVNGLRKRFDLLIYNQKAQPFLLVECKAPGVAISDQVFSQISLYNVALSVPFLLVTNGRDSYFCEINLSNHSYKFIDAFNLDKMTDHLVSF